jgi:hypothetical protein
LYSEYIFRDPPDKNNFQLIVNIQRFAASFADIFETFSFCHQVYRQ